MTLYLWASIHTCMPLSLTSRAPNEDSFIPYLLSLNKGFGVFQICPRYVNLSLIQIVHLLGYACWYLVGCTSNAMLFR